MHLVLASLSDGNGSALFVSLLELLGRIALILLFFSFWFYILSAILLARSARRENRNKPGMLFFTACALQFGLLGLFIFVVRYCHPFILLLIAFSLLVGVVYTNLPPQRSPKFREIRQAQPLPRLQFYIVDLCVGVLYYGLLLALYLLVQDALLHGGEETTPWYDSDKAPTVWQLWTAALPDDRPRLVPSHILILEVAMLLSVAVSLFAALDVLRRTAPLGCAKRSLAVLGTLLFFTVTFVAGGLAAWAAWRTALSVADMEEWREQNQLKRSPHRNSANCATEDSPIPDPHREHRAGSPSSIARPPSARRH